MDHVQKNVYWLTGSRKCSYVHYPPAAILDRNVLKITLLTLEFHSIQENNSLRVFIVV